MKKFRILMGATALTLVAATVIACHKEKAETTNLPKKITILKDFGLSNSLFLLQL